MYTVDYFIKKFEAIPEEKWCHDRQDDYGKRCAHGHCYKPSENPSEWSCKTSSEELALCEIAEKYYSIIEASGFGYINNGWNSKYQQPTPKQRVLAALYDIKKIQGEIKTDQTFKPVSYTKIIDEILVSAQ